MRTHPRRPALAQSLIWLRVWVRLAKRLAGLLVNLAQHLVDLAPPTLNDEIGIFYDFLRNARSLIKNSLVNQSQDCAIHEQALLIVLGGRGGDPVYGYSVATIALHGEVPPRL